MNIIEEFNSMTDDERRDARVAVLMQGGLSRSDAMMVDEVANKAVEQAFESLIIACKTLPPMLEIPAYMIALRMVGAHVDLVVAQLLERQGLPLDTPCMCPRCTEQRRREMN